MASNLKKEFPEIFPKSLEEWRAWLGRHHAEEGSIWLVFPKKDSGLPGLTIDPAIDEALCFGWIDSVINKRDDVTFKIRFSPRNPKSNWSRVNKDKMARLLEQHRVRSAGLAMIELAKQTGTWTALDDVENLVIPDDLQRAFAEFPRSETNFDAFPRSTKRGILEWILTAKRADTRAKRIEETARLASQNIRANQYIPK
ncbi:MAG: YdeI/OmpD-associated family protein [Bacteroidota bacterium]